MLKLYQYIILVGIIYSGYEIWWYPIGIKNANTIGIFQNKNWKDSSQATYFPLLLIDTLTLSLLFGELSASISCRRDVGTTTVPDVLYYNCCCQHHPSLPHCPFLFNSHKLTSPSLHFLFASIRVDQQQRSKWKQAWRVSLTLVIEISQRWPYPCCTKRELT